MAPLNKNRVYFTPQNFIVSRLPTFMPFPISKAVTTKTMQTQRAIFNATAACRKSFIACQDVDGLMKAEWAENRLADFNLWASGTGASGRSRASLDARLALRPDARDVITNLLLLLNTAVEECIALGKITKLTLGCCPLSDVNMDFAYISQVGHHLEHRSARGGCRFE